MQVQRFRRVLFRQASLVTLAGTLLLPVLAIGGDDTIPPELKSLRFTPATIDTSTGAAAVTLSFSVTDDASGATYFEASFLDPSGAFHQSASVKFAATLAATNSLAVTFPQSSNAGTWTLSHVFLGDAAGNTSILSTDDLSRRGFPTSLEVISRRDTVSPKMTALEFPAAIDTSAGPVDVKVNYTATDDLSGVNYIEMSFLGPSGVARRGSSAKLDAARSVSNSMTVTFPRFSEAGEWTLSAVLLSDAARNTLVLDAEGLTRLGFRTTLNVRSASDTTPPILTGLRFSPEAIDTSQGPATVKVDFTATDDLAGVNYVELSFLSPSGNARQGGVLKFDAAKSASNSIAVTFPRLSEAGDWTLNNVFLSDAAGNTLILDSDGVARAGIRPVLRVGSTQDTIPPVLTAFRFSVDTIDTRQGPAAVKVELSASDNFSGVKSVEVVVTSPSGNVSRSGSAIFPPAKEVTGTVDLTFLQYSEPGVWRVASVMLADAAGNTLILDRNAMANSALQVR